MRVIAFFIILFFYSQAFCSEGAPQRIISLGSTITEEIYLLGLGDNLVGVTVYCQRPADAKSKEKVGAITGVNIEKIVRLKPDLVLATSLTDPNAKEKLKSLGMKVVEFSYAKNFEEICQEFLKLATLVGKKNEAEQIAQRAELGIENIKSRVKGLPKPKVFIQIGAKPLFTVTEDSFINDFVAFAGGINIAGGSKSGLYSREKVLKENPDIIIIATMGIAGEKEKEAWHRYKTLSASKQNKIYIIDSYMVCGPTPASFVVTLEYIAGILHPSR